MPKLFYTLITVLVSYFASAQANDRFTNYNVNEGLSQSSIDDIIQDKDGFLWVGTANGLCRFDGYRFKVYKQSSKDSTAISTDRGFHFHNDQKGRLWLVSYNGISLYNARTDNFTNLLFYEHKELITIENHFFGEDAQYLYTGLCGYGMVKIDKQTARIYPIGNPIGKHPPAVNAWYHGFLENGKIWGIDNGGFNKNLFFIYDTKNKTTDTIHIPVTDVINLNDSEVLGLHTSNKEMLLINKKTLAYRAIRIMDDATEANILHIYKLSNHEALLCSSTKGLFYLDTETGKITKRIIVTDPENNKSFLYTICAYTDRSGNLWVGTRGDGLQKLNNPYKKFKWYRSDSSNSNNVFSIYADNDRVYVGGQGHGFNIFARNKGFIQNVTVNKNLKAIVNNAYTITPYGKDKLMIIGHSSKKDKNNIPFTYSTVTGQIQMLDAGIQKIFSDYWGRGNLRHFLFKEANESILTNIGEYLVALDVCGPGKLCPRVVHRFANETLSNCFRDHKGDLWLGTYSGIYYLDKTGWLKISLPRNSEIKTINEDLAGNIWLGTPDEIFVLDSQHKLIQDHTEENGLVNGHLYGILRDDDGNMWFSHNKGLSVYRWKEKKFEHYAKEDGLQSSEFNAGAFFKASDGELFFGGINGVTSFYPREILRNTNTPQVKITGIKLFDDPLKTDTAYWTIHKLELPYTENSLSFEFALPEFTNPAKNRYTYTMEGIDPGWIDAGDKRFTRYAGLRPGHYTFKVNAANNDGVLGKEPESINITIVPPFWQRTWFIVIAILFFIGLAVGVGIFIQKIRQKKAIRALELQHKIQLERERISRDLHDNVGTQLSLMSKNIDGVINPLLNVSDAERIHNLSSISQTSKEVIFTLRETIWALNKEEISLEELSDKLKGFTQKLFELNNNCRLLYTEEIEEPMMILSPSEAIHLFRICQEAITNSLKYANAATMQVGIYSQNGKYRITIADDGIGFEPGIMKATAHYGLENMKYRSAEISCEFTIDTMPGKGTRITITKK